MKWLISLSILIMLACLSGTAWTADNRDPAQLVRQARQAYDQGAYLTAIDLYQQLIDKGYQDGTLYYNLGNAAFKAGQLGAAIAYYRRAAKQYPWDEDIEHNLEFARRLVKKTDIERGPIEAVVNGFFLKLSAEQLSLAALALYLPLMGMMALFILKKNHQAGWKWVAAALGLLFMGTALLASIRVMVANNVKWGVIVSDQAEARNGPGDDYQVGFTIPEGREVRVFSQESDWIAIGLTPEGYKGWVKIQDIWRE